MIMYGIVSEMAHSLLRRLLPPLLLVLCVYGIKRRIKYFSRNALLLLYVCVIVAARVTPVGALLRVQ